MLILSDAERKRVLSVVSHLIDRARGVPLALSAPQDHATTQSEALAYAYRIEALDALDTELQSTLSTLESDLS